MLLVDGFVPRLVRVIKIALRVSEVQDSVVMGFSG